VTSSRDIAWVTGLLEGEGITLRVRMIDRDIIERGRPILLATTRNGP
jgi:hypothetical protein